jgi:DNA-binding CsgD family transcriptional regulator
MALNGYLDGYTYYTELLNSSGRVICVRITPYILNYSENYRDYLLLFTEVSKDPFFQTGITSDALTAGLSHANIALAIFEDNLITLANDVFLGLMPTLRRDGRDLFVWLNEISPEYRKPFRKQWDRGIRRLQPFTVELTLKSDKQVLIYLTVVPRQQKVGEHVTTKLFLIGKLQEVGLINATNSTSSHNPAFPVSGEKATAKDVFGLLTKTERRVASFIRKGWSSKDIARELDISPGTVNIHRKNIRRKLSLTGEKVNLSRALALLNVGQPN